MEPFHLGCPLTSLPVCHCRLYTPAPPLYARDPLRIPPPKNENSLRRALLLDMISSIRAPPGYSQAPPKRLTRALFWRSMHGRLPPVQDKQLFLSQVMRACDLEKEEALVQVAAKAARAREKVDRAREELERMELRDGRRDRDTDDASKSLRQTHTDTDTDRNHQSTDTESPPDDSEDEEISIRQLAERRAPRSRVRKRGITRRRR